MKIEAKQRLLAGKNPYFSKLPKPPKGEVELEDKQNVWINFPDPSFADAYRQALIREATNGKAKVWPEKAGDSQGDIRQTISDWHILSGKDLYILWSGKSLSLAII